MNIISIFLEYQYHTFSMLCHQYKYFFNFLHILFSYYNIKHNTCHYFLPLEHYKTTKKHPVGDYNALRYPVSHEVFLCCYLLLCFFLEITSKAMVATAVMITHFCYSVKSTQKNTNLLDLYHPVLRHTLFPKFIFRVFYNKRIVFLIYFFLHHLNTLK